MDIKRVLEHAQLQLYPGLLLYRLQGYTVFLSPRHNNSINSFRKVYNTWLYRLHQGLSSHYLDLWLLIFIVYLISVSVSVSVSECMRQGDTAEETEILKSMMVLLYVFTFSIVNLFYHLFVCSSQLHVPWRRSVHPSDGGGTREDQLPQPDFLEFPSHLPVYRLPAIRQ